MSNKEKTYCETVKLLGLTDTVTIIANASGETITHQTSFTGTAAQTKNSKIKLWQPSNSTVGDAFIADWCGTCARDFRDTESCDICMRTMSFNTNDSEYPNEWRYDKDGDPVCTAYIPEGEPIPSPRDDKTIDMFGEEQ